MKGKATISVKVIGDDRKTGTTVTFHPDATIFEKLFLIMIRLRERLRETAFLTKV